MSGQASQAITLHQPDSQATAVMSHVTETWLILRPEGEDWEVA